MVLSDASDDPWTEVGRYPRVRDAEAAALVLASAGIGSRLVREPQDVMLFVAAADALRAGYELIEYDRENRRRPAPALPSVWEGADAALAYATLLIVVYVAAGRQMFGLDWETAGYAQAGLMRDGEWWRALTALTLHADLGHLASNVFAGGMLGLYLAQILGPGLTWLAILLAGGLGNALNALVVSPAAYVDRRLDERLRGARPARRARVAAAARQAGRAALRSWLPLAAGSCCSRSSDSAEERTDFGAHIAGFVVGVAGRRRAAFCRQAPPAGPPRPTTPTASRRSR